MGDKPTKKQLEQKLSQVQETLRREMIDGVYPTGSFLPSEAALSKRFDVSNKSLRRGLEKLVEEGWLDKLPGVGNRVRQQKARVELKLVCNPGTVVNVRLDEVLERFHAAYPWITVRYEPFHGLEKLNEECPPDVLLLDNTQFHMMIENGYLERLQPQQQHPDTYPMIRRLFVHGGHAYFRPVLFSPIVLCYNKRHFREAGLHEPNGSWTWDDLMHHGGLLSKETGRYGFCFQVNVLNRWPIFLLQSGGRFEWTEDNRPLPMDKTAILSGIRTLRSIVQNRDMFPVYWFENRMEAAKLFAEGKLSMTLSSYMHFHMWAGEDAEPEYDISPLPLLDTPRTLVIALGVGVNRHTRYPEEARLFADFLTSRSEQQWLRDRSYGIPAMQSLDPNSPHKEVKQPARYELYREMMFSYCAHTDLQFPISGMSRLFAPVKHYVSNLIDEEECCARIEQILAEPAIAGWRQAVIDAAKPRTQEPAY